MSWATNVFRTIFKVAPALGVAMIPGFREAYSKNPQKALTYAALATGAIATATFYGYRHYEKNKMEQPQQVQAQAGESTPVKPQLPR